MSRDMELAFDFTDRGSLVLRVDQPSRHSEKYLSVFASVRWPFDLRSFRFAYEPLLALSRSEVSPQRYRGTCRSLVQVDQQLAHLPQEQYWAAATFDTVSES